MTADWRSEWESIKKYLPQYLSDPEQKELFEMLKDFENRSTEYYSSNLSLEGIIKQGDGLYKMPFFTLPATTVKNTPVLIFSNTCDISKDNRRNYSTNVMYAPIIKLDTFKVMLNQKIGDDTKVNTIITAIVKQHKSDILYLPPSPGYSESGIVFLDSICSCRLDYFYEQLINLNSEKRLSLSQFGHYLFVLKLSIHFSRLGEGNCRTD